MVQLDQTVGAELLQRPGLAAAAGSPPMAAVVAAVVPCTIVITANEAMASVKSRSYDGVTKKVSCN